MLRCVILVLVVQSVLCRDIIVPLGREVLLSPSDIPVTEPGPMCMVEAPDEEALNGGIGEITPRMFRCNFTRGQVKYTHFGSPYWKRQDIRLLVYELRDNETRVTTPSLHFAVEDGPHSRFVRPHGSLKVPAPLGLSGPIDESVLALPTEDGVDCRVHFSSGNGRPTYGRLVLGSRRIPIDSVTRSCRDFVAAGVRYERTAAQLPNVDFVQVLVEVVNKEFGPKIFERVQVVVEIGHGRPNETPRLPSEQSVHLPRSRVPVPTPFEILGAEDGEFEKIVFNVTRRPSRGDVVCLASLLPCTSFDRRQPLAYLPRGIETGTEPDVAEVVALDEFLRPSRPLRLHFASEKTIGAPLSAVVSALFVAEGRSRKITGANLFLPDRARIFLTGGLFHGKMEVGGRVASYFTADDVSSGRVRYVHDDSDSTTDNVHLLVMDPSEDEKDQETTLFLPVKILPRDDEAPMLVINREIAVMETQSVPIGPQALSARDPDSPRRDIRYHVTGVPRNGALLKRLPDGRTSDLPIRSFTQEEVDEGLLIYRHLQNGTFSDSFEVVLKDGSVPPNRSPPVIVLVTVVPPGPPPTPDPDSSFYLITAETEMHALTRAHVNFLDTHSSPADLLYTLTGPPRLVEGLGMSRSRPGWLADPAWPLTPLASFTQEQVDRRRVAYCAGAEDVGYYSQKVAFDMTLRDRVGRVVSGVVFNVSVLPVNDQPPSLNTGTLVLDEGTTALVTTAAIGVHDDDTLLSGLQISVLIVPLHGSLNRNGFVLRVGDLLSPEDILAHRLEYKHDGSENFADAFSVGANDGVGFATGRVDVRIRPVDDELPRWLPGLVKKILVEEGSRVVLTSEVLSATDLDTDDDLLHFILTEGPRHGDVLVDGKPSMRCTQADVIEGRVVYRTKEGTVKSHGRHDSMTWVVSDRALPPFKLYPAHVVGVLILSRNNRAPRASVRSPLKVVEGGRAVVDVLEALDEDGDSRELVFYVTREPLHGFLENVRPPHPRNAAPATGPGRKVVAFSERDLVEGLVSYVQDRHRGSEPTSDEAVLYASDGQFNSSEVTLRMEISGINDEPPTIEAQNLTVDEGGLLKITRDLVTFRDADQPPDVLVVAVAAGPLYGSLVLLARNGRTVETSFATVNAVDFYGRVGYRHDGSENFRDWFVLNVTDGRHATTCNVSVLVSPVDDEPPFLVHNLGVVLPDADRSVAISAERLLVEDRDTPPEKILCTVTDPPALGTIEVEGVVDDVTTSFAQMDVSDGRVRYVLVNETTNVEDGFRLVCSDGVRNTSEVEFRVWLRPRLTVTSTGAIVQVGKKVPIESHVLSTNEVPYPATSIVFEVTRMPRSGRLEISGVPVSAFTMADVLLRRLGYVHGGEGSGSDRFDFLACIPSGSCTDGTFPVTVRPAARPETPPTLHVLSPLRVPSDGPRTLTSQHLYARDALAPPVNVTFQVTKKPEHGVLLLGGVLLASETFSQEDVNRGLLSYRRLESGSHPSDSFLFRVSNGRVPGFLYRGLRRLKPVKFEILLVNIIGSVPVVTFHEASSAFHRLPSGRRGFSLRGFLRSRDVASEASLLLYSVTEVPEKGVLVPCNSSVGMPLSSFMESDLDNGGVCYVPDDANAVKDGFSFKVQNKESRTVGPYRLDLEWTTIVPSVPAVLLCKNKGTVKVNFRRTGDVSKALSAAVRVIASNGTSTSGATFDPTLAFEAGSTTSTWTAYFSGNVTGLAGVVRQFVVEPTKLHDGGVLNSPVPTLLTLLGSDLDVCSNATGESISWRTLEESGYIDASDCSVGNVRPSLKYDEATGQFQKCTRNGWVPWKHKGTLLHQGTFGDGGTECPKSWQPWQDRCYRWFRKGATWTAAKARCRALDSDLVSVVSVPHRAWLVKLARERPFWILADTSDVRASLHSHPCPLQRGIHRPLRKHCGQIHGFVCGTERPKTRSDAELGVDT